ncbi:unnamed protein product [Brassicogethes aeneus]|uniref:SWIM-type domain-containing protein n=1 Tax=Brassicogethes aeneus TaxID=1431903 RepID=A0A9P0FEA3_BRAAE|nr:unnamed protein product [Brassicogethes aeneus]
MRINYDLTIDEDHKRTLCEILPGGGGDDDPCNYEGLVIKTEALVKGFSAVIRLNVNKKEQALNWLKHFQEKSKITFRVKRTHAENTERIIFKKEFHCIHDTKPSRNSKPHEKHLNCNAKLTITIKNKEMKRSKDEFLKRYPCIILLRHNHNHPIYSSSSLRFRPPSEQLQNEFRLLFEKGHSPATALTMFKDKLLEENGDKYHEIAADGGRCPTQKWVYDLYYEIFKKEYGEPTGTEMIDSMEKAIKNYNTKCGSECAAIKKTDNLVIAICSPIMKRVHNYIRASSEIMFVDSSGNMDRHNTRVFLFLCPSVAGALPLGILMTYSESEQVITAGIELLKGLLDKQSFYGQNYPQVIITDDCDAERNSLKFCFKHSSVILCKFHVLQSVMRYLWNSNNGVKKNDRVEIYQIFRRALNSPKEEEFLTYYNMLLEKNNNKKVLKYFIDLKCRANVWAMCYRSHLLTRGNETNNYAEATFRILKDKILLRKKAFSIVHLFDYLTSAFEEYYFKKIIDIINGRWEGAKQKNKYYFKKEVISNLVCIELNENIYEVTSNEKSYIVNSELEICSCYVGYKGAPCKHQFAVIKKFGLNRSQQFHPSLLKCDFKKLLHKVIYGTDCNIEDWYLDLNEMNEDRPRLSHNEQEHPILNSDAVKIPLQEVKLNEQNKNTDEVQKKLEGFVSLLMEKYENNFQEYGRPVTNFLENIANCKTDSSFVSALYTFGKYGAGMPKILKGKNLQGGNNIGVQPTAIMRRKIGLKSRNTVHSGRPPKRARLTDHAYAKIKNYENNYEVPKCFRIAAPHLLSYCVDNNVALGKTHSKK